MKIIVLVTPTLGGGGAERTTIQLANGLAEQNELKVYLAVSNTNGHKGQLRSEISSKVELVDFNCQRMSTMLIPFAKWLKLIKPNTVISTQTHTNIIVYCAIQLSGCLTKLICREVSTASINLKHIRGIKKLILKVIMRWVYSHVNTVIAVSRGVADDLRHYLDLPLTNLEVIYNPVITPILYEKAQESLNHPWFMVDRKEPVILAVGRLTEAKNYPMLLQAFSLLVADTPAHLVILGEGEERVKLECLIEELNLKQYVLLVGFEINPYRYMARCDVYVMSSNWEGLPGSLIQALALGAKVVSTDCPSGPREVLNDGEYGKLVPCNNIEALYQALNSDFLNGKNNYNKFNVNPFMELNALNKYGDLV